MVTVLLGSVQDNLKKVTNKDYLVGWHASQHPRTFKLNQQPKVAYMHKSPITVKKIGKLFSLHKMFI
jgi:hypothetical protein